MRHAILCNGPTFILESWGNGLSYSLRHVPSNREWFGQGDDALIFEGELETCEHVFPDNTAEQNCAWLWDQLDYQAASQPIAA